MHRSSRFERCSRILNERSGKTADKEESRSIQKLTNIIYARLIRLTTAFYWLLGGNIFYYASGIALAYLLKDNRAFCKYVCPITAVLKISSRFSLLKVADDAEKCTECSACVRVCPMDIRIPEYIKNGRE
jgi:polyferredoxin